LGDSWLGLSPDLCALGVGDHGKTRGADGRNFRELRGGNGAREVRGAVKMTSTGGGGQEEASHFVDGFVAKSGINYPNFAATGVLFEKMNLARGRRRDWCGAHRGKRPGWSAIFRGGRARPFRLRSPRDGSSV